MNTFHFTLSTPNGVVFDEEIQSIVLRNATGDLAIYANHTAIITDIVPSVCTVTRFDNTQNKYLLEKGGLLHVLQNTAVLLSPTIPKEKGVSQ